MVEPKTAFIPYLYHAGPGKEGDKGVIIGFVALGSAFLEKIGAGSS